MKKRRRESLLVVPSATATVSLAGSVSTAPMAKASVDANTSAEGEPESDSDQTRSGGEFETSPTVTARTVLSSSAAIAPLEKGLPEAVLAATLVYTAGGVTPRSMATIAEPAACLAPSL